MYLGIDTSCYTTSAALTENGEIISDERIILDVKQGERGLRQSDAVFMHMKNLPILINRIKDKLKYVQAVSVSETPRRAEGSYMPVFAAGTAFAEVIADSLGVPLFKTTHQEGHIAAAVLTGTFVLEKIYAVPGMGKFYVQSINDLDYTMVLGMTSFYGVFLVTANLIVDVLYGFIDPRIKLAGGGKQKKEAGDRGKDGRRRGRWKVIPSFLPKKTSALARRT